MKIIFFLFQILLAIFLLLSCGSPTVSEGPELIIHNTHQENSTHVGKGVWMNVPPGFNPSNSFSGVKNFTGTGYIEIVQNQDNWENYLSRFSQSSLANRKCKLLERRAVKFGNISKAYFFKDYYERHKTYRSNLIIRPDQSNFHIKASRHESDADLNDEMLFNALLSCSFGAELVEDKQLFKMAELVNVNHLIFTKDGMLPSKHPEGAKMEYKIIESLTKDQVIPFMTAMGKNLNFSLEPSWVNELELKGAEFYVVKKTINNQKILLALLRMPQGNAVSFEVSGSDKMNLNEVEQFIITNSVINLLTNN